MRESFSFICIHVANFDFSFYFQLDRKIKTNVWNNHTLAHKHLCQKRKEKKCVHLIANAFYFILLTNDECKKKSYDVELSKLEQFSLISPILDTLYARIRLTLVVLIVATLVFSIRISPAHAHGLNSNQYNNQSHARARSYTFFF